jgi:hypothetical protein
VNKEGVLGFLGFVFMHEYWVGSGLLDGYHGAGDPYFSLVFVKQAD